ncbi:ROK family transcriptional regulator [Ferroacidibacillus organovorans]|uniref:Sugar kinase n=1 Tax=Ferroacidibacillus organovorans TaxID=1765683 RepID=A0A1V4ETM6_9BACL|nr:ROK family transcriptional regulator [Ferroacidibacillus organovorans]OPG16285.1 hypothetical protein B2M26_07370 [Ferroacidibacillus organovorans]
MEAANNMVLRDLNMNSIFQTIQHRGPISRVEISEQTGLAASTVSVLTSELQGSGFIRESGYATSTGGRRPILLEVNPEGGHFICADLTGSQITVGVLDLSFQVLREWSFEKTRVSGEDLYRELIKALSSALSWCEQNSFKTLGIGVATPGLMDLGTGKIVEASNLGWRDLDLGKLLEQEFHLSVTVENDTNAAAYGEFLYGSEHTDHARNMLYIAVGTGVGAGMIIERELYKGSLGMAGEIGHIVIQESGHMCTCGKRGCLETVVSEPALLREYNRKMNASSMGSIQNLVEQSEAGDVLARDVLFNAGHILGVVAGNHVNVLNVDSVVFGGDAITRGHVMFAAIIEGLHEVLLPGFEKNLKIRVSSLPLTAGYVGVAYSSLTSVLNKYGFQVPAKI